MRVPQYEPQVQEQEGQAVRVPQLSTPPEAAFGTGVAQATQQLGNTIEHASDQLFEHMMTRTKAAQRAQVIQATNQYKMSLQNVMFGTSPQEALDENGQPKIDPRTNEPIMIPTGVFNRQGYDAHGATSEFDQKREQIRAAAINSVGSPYQKQAMQEAADEDYARYRELVARHEGTQVRMGHNATNEQFRETLINNAANTSNDPAAALKEMQTIESNIHQDFLDNGVGNVFAPGGASSVDDGIIKKADQSTRRYMENAFKPLIGEDPAKAIGWLDRVKSLSDASGHPIVSPAAYSDLKDKIMTESRQKAELIKFQQNQMYDENLKKGLSEAIGGGLTPSEVERRFQNGELNKADFTTLHSITSNPKYQIRKLGVFDSAIEASDPSIFNEIREAQLNRDKTPGQIDRMISDAMRAGTIKNVDNKYLLDQNKNLPPNPIDQATTAQANSLRKWASSYYDFTPSLIDRLTGKAKEQEAAKSKEIESVVSEFYKQADSRKATPEDLDSLRRQIQHQAIVTKFPEMAQFKAGQEPDVIVGIDGKITHLFGGEEPRSSAKAKYKITPTAEQDSLDEEP